MENKIVSIFTTVFMLIMCMLAMLTLNITNMNKSNDLELARASSSVLSTNGEIDANSEVILRGSSLISSIIGSDIIDARLDDGDKIYTTHDYNTAGGVMTPSKIYKFNGLISSSSEVLSKIDPMGYYSITYDGELKDSTYVEVTIKQILTEAG